MNTRKTWSDNLHTGESVYLTSTEILNKMRSDFDIRRYYGAEGKSVVIDGTVEQVIIQQHTNPINAEKVDRKICVAYNSILKTGSLILYEGNYWLTISEIKDVDGAYKTAQILQTNVTVKWQNSSGTTKSYCAVYQNPSGIGTDTNKIIKSQEGKYEILLPLNSDTVAIVVDDRFVFGTLTGVKNVVVLDNDFISHNYNNGVDGIVILTVETDKKSSTDSTSLMIADYVAPVVVPTPTGNCAITYTGKPEIKIGGSYTTFTAVFKDSLGVVLPNITAIWTVIKPSGYESLITTLPNGNSIGIKAANDIGTVGDTIVGKTIVLSMTELTGAYSASINIIVKGLI